MIMLSMDVRNRELSSPEVGGGGDATIITMTVNVTKLNSLFLWEIFFNLNYLFPLIDIIRGIHEPLQVYKASCDPCPFLFNILNFDP